MKMANTIMIAAAKMITRTVKAEKSVTATAAAAATTATTAAVGCRYGSTTATSGRVTVRTMPADASDNWYMSLRKYGRSSLYTIP
jgi:hypothetical protein